MQDTSLTIRIEPSLMKAAEQTAAANDETLSEVLGRALQQYVQAKTVRRATFPIGFIHLLAQSNPKQRGSASEEAFARYREGMSTAEYAEALKKEPLQGHVTGGVRGALAWDLARENIEIYYYCGIILTECSPSALKAHSPILHARRPWLVGDRSD
jgi:hypothetical protein